MQFSNHEEEKDLYRIDWAEKTFATCPRHAVVSAHRYPAVYVGNPTPHVRVGRILAM